MHLCIKEEKNILKEKHNNKYFKDLNNAQILKKKELADSNGKICKRFDFLSVLRSQKKLCVCVCASREREALICVAK